MIRIFAFAIALSIVQTVGCASGNGDTSPQGSAAPSAPLENTQWRLVRVSSQSVDDAGDASPSLRLNSEGARLEGNTGCNQMFGQYQRSGATLRFTGIGMTKRACTDPRRNEIERMFVEALNGTQRFEISGDTLRLLGSTDALAHLVVTPG